MYYSCIIYLISSPRITAADAGLVTAQLEDLKGKDLVIHDFVLQLYHLFS